MSDLPIEPSPSWCGPRLCIDTVSKQQTLHLTVDLTLEDGETVTIGRGEGALIQLTDGHVSKQHLLLTRRGEEIAVADAGSRWGTRLNGRALEAPTPLAHGDTLVIGVTTLRFERFWDVLTRPVRTPEPTRGTGIFELDPASSMSSGIRQLPRPVQVRPVQEPAAPPAAWEQNARIAALVVLALCAIYFIVFIFRPM
ncbi:MAG: FHA domain-containing protein [Planctomycetota bacterium]|nr:FHA domain-containing protein [Planctomycetota bacterium]